MTTAAYRAGGRLHRRYPDMFTEGGKVHPIRNSPGYDVLEDRARAHAREQEDSLEAYRAGQRVADAELAYRELRREVLSEGGIAPDKDYPAVDIPPDLRRPGGKPPDEMAVALEAQGYHYADAEEMLRDLRRRRALVESTGGEMPKSPLERRLVRRPPPRRRGRPPLRRAA